MGGDSKVIDIRKARIERDARGMLRIAEDAMMAYIHEACADVVLEKGDTVEKVLREIRIAYAEMTGRLRLVK